MFSVDQKMPHSTMWYSMLLLMLLITIRRTSAQITEALFDMVETGQNISGKIGSEMTARKNIECTSM